MNFKKRSSPLVVLVCLALLSILAQLSFFIIHTHANELVDALVGSSIPAHFFHLAVFWPLLEFVGLQITAHLILLSFIWFLTVSCSEAFRLSPYGLSFFFWLTANLTVFLLNSHFFPHSFFALRLPYAEFLLGVGISILAVATLCAYLHLIRQRKRVAWGLLFISLAGLTLLASGLNYFWAQPFYRVTGTPAKPNIILIGLDSLRPDYIGYSGKTSIQTPHLDQFLRTGIHFKEAYTPLARTFPAWISILTAKHPKNSYARINLNSPEQITVNATLAKRLQAANYETIYATDEKRFSNITTAYGFDQLIGPRMGLNDFMLGGLSDFPLTNLLVNLPFGRFLFPYNYANRAAAITYEPDQFLELVKLGLSHRQNKPLFLALHFCMTHWPFTWAGDHQPANFSLDERYHSSVERADHQLGDLLRILKENGLLEHSLVVLLSDHGTSFGLPGDRLLERQHYLGPPARLNWVTANKLSRPVLSSSKVQQHYSLNTAYGQGTDVLSLKQYQVLLAFKYFGSSSLFLPHPVHYRCSLLDLAPTILALLELAPLQPSDGISLLPLLLQAAPQKKLVSDRAFYLETGYSVSEIETNQIAVEKVLKSSIQLYQVNPENGYLFIKPSAETAILKNKQRAVLLGPWLLARYPASSRHKLSKENHSLVFKSYVQPAYYLLANIETGEWTLGLDTALAKKAPLAKLEKRLKGFYGAEL